MIRSMSRVPAPILAALALALGSADSAGAADGAALFAQNCAMCHQSDAAGLPGQYPRLKGRVGPISAKARGRAYLIHVVTYGMAGRIDVDQQAILGVMPALRLSDEDAARVLSYLGGLAYPRSTAFTAAEVAAERARGPMSGGEVNAERRNLRDAKVLE